MFGFEPEEADALGSQGRFSARIKKFHTAGRRFPKLEHYFWWIVHNGVAHMCLALAPIKLSFDFHDWTSKKLNAMI